MRPRRILFPTFVLFSILLFTFVGCSEDTVTRYQDDDGDGSAFFDGNYDGGEVVIQRTSIPFPDGTLVSIELIATDIHYSADIGELSAQVAIRNASRRDLYAPARLFVGLFRPDYVKILNADAVVRCDSTSTDPLPAETRCGPYRFMFDYSATFTDGMLGEGQTSAFREWIFGGIRPGTGFSFGVRADIALSPARPTLSGRIFADADRDGIADPDEGPWFGGQVSVRYPSGIHMVAMANEKGYWRVPVDEPGLYEARYLPPPVLTPIPWILTTPNPLQVMLPAGPDGGAVGFDQANFGVYSGPFEVYPYLEMFDGPSDSVSTDFYHLLGIEYVTEGSPIELPYIRREFLRFRVGYSGCSADHPFRLFAGTGFMESNPPQTWIKLSHDNLGELCDAYFEDTMMFDLRALRAHQIRMYGSVGPLILRLDTPDGSHHMIRIP